MSPANEALALDYLSQIREAAVQARHAIGKAVDVLTSPAVRFKARIFPEGNRWCAQIGEDPALIGYGHSPDHACEDLADIFYGRPRAPIPTA